MRKISVAVLVAGAALAAASCTNSPTSPGANSPVRANHPEPEVKGSTTRFKVEDFVGTWQATKAEAWRFAQAGDGFVEVAGSRRDLVAEGGKVTLVLEGSPNESAAPRYTITVTMPGGITGVDSGSWIYTEFHDGRPQIDIYPSSIPDPDYGDIMGFYVALSDNTLKFWDSGQTFLPFDFGWDPWSTGLNLEFARK